MPVIAGNAAILKFDTANFDYAMPLADFQSSYVAEDGAIHFKSPGLQTNWENLLIWVMPNRVRGQTYCHLPTVAYMKRVAAGTTEPGATITTVDDAPTQPPTN